MRRGERIAMADNDRHALVTGASRGIGAAIARTLADDGFFIWLNYLRDHEAANAVKREIEASGGECRLLPFDVADPEASARAIGGMLDEAVPYALVNNAGFARDCPMGLMSHEDWQRVVDVHLGGFYNVTRPIVPHMQRRRRGRIVNIVSTSGQAGTPGQVNYSAAKAGVIGATRALAREVASRNVLVNAVSPGFIDTDMTRDLPREQIIQGIPMGRPGTPLEVAKVVRFLCSDDSSYVTGQVLAVNGGVY